jgi:hypothetical protein
VRFNCFFVLLLALLAVSCLKVEPIEVKPIHIVMDVNIRVDRELDQFFAFENAAASSPATQAATQPGIES